MASAVCLPLEMFFERESRHPNKTYLIQPLGGGQVEQLTWAEVDTRVDRAAHALAGRGLEPGSRVALMIGNRPEFAIAYFGILRAGMVAVPLNTGYTSHEVTRQCADSEMLPQISQN